MSILPANSDEHNPPNGDGDDGVLHEVAEWLLRNEIPDTRPINERFEGATDRARFLDEAERELRLRVEMGSPDFFKDSNYRNDVDRALRAIDYVRRRGASCPAMAVFACHYIMLFVDDGRYPNEWGWHEGGRGTDQ